jgi:hypothetical protein
VKDKLSAIRIGSRVTGLRILRHEGGTSHIDRNAPGSPIAAIRIQSLRIAFRPEVLRRDEDAPAGPERAREGDATVGCVAVERDVHAPLLAEQR